MVLLLTLVGYLIHKLKIILGPAAPVASDRVLVAGLLGTDSDGQVS